MGYFRNYAPIMGIGMIILLAGCSAEFTDFSPTEGSACDTVRIDGHHHRVGDIFVYFNGVRSEQVFFHTYPGETESQLTAIVPLGATTGPIRVLNETGWGVIIGALGGDHTFEEDFRVWNSNYHIPRIGFRATPDEILEGESSTLSWILPPFIRLDGLYLNGGSYTNLDVLSRDPSEIEVSPTRTTTYELRKEIRCQTRTETAIVTVNPVQRPPVITHLGETTVAPGDEVDAYGEHLRFGSLRSELVFVQGGVEHPVIDSSPEEDHLNARLPAALVAGPATVFARVDAMTSAAVRFTIEEGPLPGRANGVFIEITSRINLAALSDEIECGTEGHTLEITERPAGSTTQYRAHFKDDGSTVERINFDTHSLGGAALSPRCENGVVVHSLDPTGVGLDDEYMLMVYRYARDRTRDFRPIHIWDGSTLADGWFHVLFSPDDSIVIYSSAASSSPRDLSIHIFDLEEWRSIRTAINVDCGTDCRSLRAEIYDRINLRITLDGRIVFDDDVF